MMYDSSDLTELLALALGAVRAGARLALDPGQALRIETKRDRNDVVTQVDRAVEALIARHACAPSASATPDATTSAPDPKDQDGPFRHSTMT